MIEAAAQAGIDEFVVVTGYRAGPLETFLDRLRVDGGFAIQTVHNPEWVRPNGLSVLVAEPMLGGEYVLLMSDHLFEPGLLRALLDEPRLAGGVVLAVDRRLDNPLVDLSDVTRVKTGSGDAIMAIGKGLADYDAFDTGVFLASDGLNEGIRSNLANGGEGSISGGMTWLAQMHRARAFDIGDRFWLDVDDVGAWEQAERFTA